MALRVLLADESTTIKKVFQLALQDFAVDVQTVNLGVDVSSVAESFRPDIIFADVLLQKKSGYEVSAELKSDPDLSKIPVVLMWSSFMDIDEDRMQASQADDRLEKPFDVKTLRRLVESYVPRTREQRLSGYLSFPKLPEFEEPKKPFHPDELATEQSSPLPPSPQPTGAGMEMTAEAVPSQGTGAEAEEDWSMDTFEPLSVPSSDEFETVELKSSQESTSEEPSLESITIDSDQDLIADSKEDDQMWEEKDIQKYKVDEQNAAAEDINSIDYSDPSIDYFVSDETVDTRSIMDEGSAGQMEEDVGFDLDAINSSVESSLPKNIEGDNDIMEELDSRPLDDASATPPGQQRGQTVVLNFDFEAGTSTNSQVIGPDGTTLKQLTAELNEAAIQKVIEEQAKEIIENAVWKMLPDLATEIIERELKRLLDDNDQNLQSP
jgi:two-component system cell cycle response regulator